MATRMATPRKAGKSDRQILLAIQRLMSGVEWTPDTLDSIAELLNDNGYPVEGV